MNENELIPFCVKKKIDKFRDELCQVLTDWEQGEITDFELYSFMVDVCCKIEDISYSD